MTLTLDFDRGTLLLHGLVAEGVLSELPGMRWDPRVECYRTPARFYARLVERLDAVGARFVDRVRAPPPACPSLAGAVAVAHTPAEQRPSVVPSLRPYQAAALDAWHLSGRRGIVSLPTGSGKTFVAVAAIVALGGSALCLVPTRILLEQWRRILGESLEVEIGCFGDGVHDARPVTVATFESAWRHMHHLGNRFELLVIDEVHHFGYGLRDEALEMCTAAHRLGLSATPRTASLASTLEDLVGPIVFEIGIADLAGSYLSNFELIDLHLDLDTQEREEYESARRVFAATFEHFQNLAPGASWNDFLRWAGRTRAGREAVCAWRRSRSVLSLTSAKKETLTALLQRHRESRVLVFTSDNDAAYKIAREHLIMPITADIRGHERDRMLTAFRDGHVRALVSARVLNEGFDVPAADVGIVVGGALGEREHTQRVGRLLRPAPGKQALVYELVTRGTLEVSQATRRKHGIQSSRARAL